MPTAIILGLFWFILAILSFQFVLGALSLRLSALFEPKSTRKSLLDLITHLRRHWYDRKLPKPLMIFRSVLRLSIQSRLVSLVSIPTASISPAPMPLFIPLSPTVGRANIGIFVVCAAKLTSMSSQSAATRRSFRLQKPLLLVQSAFLLLRVGVSRADIASFIGVDD